MGSFLIRSISGETFKIAFSSILFIVGAWMVFKRRSATKLRSEPLKIAVGIGGGFLSVLTGITTFVTMYFNRTGMDVKESIAATSVCIFIKSFVVVVVLSIGLHTNIPDTIGYVNIPLLLSAAPFTVIGSILAVKTLHMIPYKVLEIYMVVLMFVSAAVMMV